MREDVDRNLGSHGRVVRPSLSGLILLGLFLLPPAVALGEESTETTKGSEISFGIDELYREHDKPNAPGGVIAVLHRGEILHLEGYGAANREHRIPWTPDTPYRIASLTKSFVVHALVLLEQRGAIDLDDSLQKHLPDFPVFDQEVTIHHLLMMSSGLWQDEQLIGLAGLRGRLTLDEMYTLSRRQETLSFAPGSTFSYVDTNYRLLARILANVTGKPFPVALKELIFDPLEMSSTWADPDTSRVFDGQAVTYYGVGGNGGRGAANVLSVPLAAFVAWLAREGRSGMGI